MTKRAAAANAKDRMKALEVHLSDSGEDEVSSVNLSSEESESDVSSGDDSVSLKAESESESESQDGEEIQKVNLASGKVNARLESIGFDDFGDFTVLRKANEESSAEYFSEIVIKNSNLGSRIGSASNKTMGSGRELGETRGSGTIGQPQKELDLNQEFQGILEKYVQLWIKNLKLKVFEDHGRYCIDVHKTEEKFKCPFLDCFKEFANNNGLTYHLTKTNHSLIKFLGEVKDFVEKNGIIIVFAKIRSKYS